MASLRDLYLDWRNRRLMDPAFQRWAAAFPLTRPIANRRARALFDLTAGFVYSQVLFACVELSVFEHLRRGPLAVDALSEKTGLPVDGAERLARAAASLGLLERRADRFGLGPHGAALLGNPSVMALIRHHAALYKDLADPVALLRGRSSETALAKFWDYAHGGSAAYSELMAETQAFIAEEILNAFSFEGHRHVMDIGGGAGAFISALKKKHPSLQATLCDLPNVAALAKDRFAKEGIEATAAACNFQKDPLPAGADVITLIRVLHDHDENVARSLLKSIRNVLPKGGTLLVCEPMADTPGAAAMGEAYFGMYLWAMGSGRPRSAAELRRLLAEVGFSDATMLSTRRPILAGILVAR